MQQVGTVGFFGLVGWAWAFGIDSFPAAGDTSIVRPFKYEGSFLIRVFDDVFENAAPVVAACFFLLEPLGSFAVAHSLSLC